MIKFLKTSFYISIILFLLGSTSCEKDDSEFSGIDSKMVGTWQHVIKFPDHDLTRVVIYKFNKNGTMSGRYIDFGSYGMYKLISRFNGTYKTSGQSVQMDAYVSDLFTIPNGSRFSKNQKLKYSVKGDILYLDGFEFTPYCIAPDETPASTKDHDPALIGTWAVNIVTYDDGRELFNIYQFRASGKCSWIQRTINPDYTIDSSTRWDGKWTSKGNEVFMVLNAPNDPDITRKYDMEYTIHNRTEAPLFDGTPYDYYYLEE